jgi:hypothetical protein
MSRKKDFPKKRTQRQRQKKTALTNNESLKSYRDWFLPEGIFSQIPLHGNIKWSPIYLVWLALCWAWSDAKNVTEAFTQALEGCQTMFGTVPLSTYQGFMNALVNWSPKLMPVVRVALRQAMERIDGKFWRRDGWVPIAFDGSRSSAPRSLSNEAAFCAKNYGKGKTAKSRKKKTKGMRRQRNEKNKPQPPEPQAWITLLWHMGLRLPWDWRLGPSNSSERAHVMEMVQAGTFPKNTLFCGDAGFIGYPLWSCMMEQGDFLVRVGGNVSLLSEYADYRTEKVGKDIHVLCWPEQVMQADQPPLRLRLLQVRLGKGSAWMLTSVLDREKLTAKAVLRFYKMRWGIEVEFRGLKQTLDRAKLRCRNDRRLLVELDWSILGMAVAELLALKEQLSQRRSKRGKKDRVGDPIKRSLAQTMRALRRCLRHLKEVPELGQDLASQLRDAVTDSYQRKRSKRARYRPRNPDKKPLGNPKLRPLSEKARKKLREFKAKKAA